MKKIMIKGEIGWEVTEKEISRQLAFARGEDVEIEIATPGGGVYEGLKIYNAIKNYAGNVIFRMVGLVASMGSYIVLARGKDNVVIEPNAVFMIHNVSGGAYGDYRIANKLFKLLDGLTAHLSTVYSGVTGQTTEEVRKLLDDETFYYGDEIIDAGFADRVAEDSTIDASAFDKESELVTAKLAVSETMQKVRAQEISKEEIEGISNFVMKLEETPAPAIVAAAAVKTEEPKTKGKAMDLETLKAEHRPLYDAIIALGMKEGAETERQRVMQIVSFRGKMPQRAIKVVDDAIKNGDNFNQFSLNAQLAIAAGDEVDAAATEAPVVPTGTETPVAEPVTEGEITTVDQLQATSNHVAGLIGLNK